MSKRHCVSCWTAYILQDDTRSLQCQNVQQLDKTIYNRLASLLHVSGFFVPIQGGVFSIFEIE